MRMALKAALSFQATASSSMFIGLNFCKWSEEEQEEEINPNRKLFESLDS